MQKPFIKSHMTTNPKQVDFKKTKSGENDLQTNYWKLTLYHATLKVPSQWSFLVLIWVCFPFPTCILLATNPKHHKGIPTTRPKTQRQILRAKHKQRKPYQLRHLLSQQRMQRTWNRTGKSDNTRTTSTKSNTQNTPKEAKNKQSTKTCNTDKSFTNDYRWPNAAIKYEVQTILGKN